MDIFNTQDNSHNQIVFSSKNSNNISNFHWKYMVAISQNCLEIHLRKLCADYVCGRSHLAIIDSFSHHQQLLRISRGSFGNQTILDDVIFGRKWQWIRTFFFGVKILGWIQSHNHMQLIRFALSIFVSLRNYRTEAMFSNGLKLDS